jgi:hypothetical protein
MTASPVWLVRGFAEARIEYLLFRGYCRRRFIAAWPKKIQPFDKTHLSVYAE